MSRRRTVVEPGAIYHVISRFVAGEFFIAGAAERQTYLSLFGFRIARSDWRCFSFAIMSNHIHLGVVAGTEALASWLRPVHTDFAQWINTRRERIGAVFVRGPNVVPIRQDGAARLISYVHNNPVRAGVVIKPSDSDWTSHRAYVGLQQRPRWLDVDGGLALAGFTDGRDLEKWMASIRVERRDLEAAHAKPKRSRGRPRGGSM